MIGADVAGGAADGTTAGSGANVTAGPGAAACRAAVVDVVGCLGLALVAGVVATGCDSPGDPPALVVGEAGAAGGGTVVAVWSPW